MVLHSWFQKKMLRENAQRRENQWMGKEDRECLGHADSHGARTPEGDQAARTPKRCGAVPPAGRWEEGWAARRFHAGGEAGSGLLWRQADTCLVHLGWASVDARRGGSLGLGPVVEIRSRGV